MKTCRMCGALATDDASVCYECMYSFERMSCEAMQPDAEDAVPVEDPGDSDAVSPSADVGLVNPAHFELRVRDAEFGERVFSLAAGSLHVGRLPTNEVVLNDATVSRRHLHIFCEQDVFWVEDFGSTNPTRLNGAIIEGRTPLREGDVIDVRGATIELRRVQS